MIPEEAVEAAAKAMLAAGNHIGGWDALPVFLQRNYTRDARAALHAAAPNLMAWALEDAADKLPDYDLPFMVDGRNVQHVSWALKTMARDYRKPTNE